MRFYILQSLVIYVCVTIEGDLASKDPMSTLIYFQYISVMKFVLSTTGDKSKPRQKQKNSFLQQQNNVIKLGLDFIYRSEIVGNSVYLRHSSHLQLEAQNQPQPNSALYTQVINSAPNIHNIYTIYKYNIIHNIHL